MTDGGDVPAQGQARASSPAGGRRSVAVGVYLPVLLFEIGMGAILPVIALTAVRLGASLAGAGLVFALLGIGQILGDIPAGAVATRVGDRRAMLLAASASVVVLTAAALSRSVVALGLCLLVLGAINAVFLLARHSFLTETTPVARRARALSTLAGLQRIGTFIGPFIGAVVIHHYGLGAAWWLAVATSVLTVCVVAAAHDGERRPSPRVATSSRQVLRDHRELFMTLGVAVVLVGASRGARQTVLPLWSEHLGLSPATTSIIFGISGAVDMLLFYPAGKLMDRRGRLWAAVPSMLVLAVGFVVLPLTTTVAGLTAAAMLIGLGNGMGSGILMTLGADVAPSATRAPFLALWRLCADAGVAAGPLVVAAGAALGSLAAGVLAMAAVSAASTAALLRWAPRWSVHANRSTRRRAGEAGSAEGVGR